MPCRPSVAQHGSAWRGMQHVAHSRGLSWRACLPACQHAAGCKHGLQRRGRAAPSPAAHLRPRHLLAARRPGGLLLRQQGGGERRQQLLRWARWAVLRTRQQRRRQRRRGHRRLALACQLEGKAVHLLRGDRSGALSVAGRRRRHGLPAALQQRVRLRHRRRKQGRRGRLHGLQAPGREQGEVGVVVGLVVAGEGHHPWRGQRGLLAGLAGLALLPRRRSSRSCQAGRRPALGIRQPAPLTCQQAQRGAAGGAPGVAQPQAPLRLRTRAPSLLLLLRLLRLALARVLLPAPLLGQAAALQAGVAGARVSREAVEVVGAGALHALAGRERRLGVRLRAAVGLLARAAGLAAGGNSPAQQAAFSLNTMPRLFAIKCLPVGSTAARRRPPRSAAQSGARRRCGAAAQRGRQAQRDVGRAGDAAAMGCPGNRTGWVSLHQPSREGYARQAAGQLPSRQFRRRDWAGVLLCASWPPAVHAGCGEPRCWGACLPGCRVWTRHGCSPRCGTSGT